MTQINNGIVTHTEDMSERPFGNYVVRATYKENDHYKGSNTTCKIHHFPTSESDHDCWQAEDFCEYNPATYERSEPGVNITTEDSYVVHDNQFLVANMKNSTGMKLTLNVANGQGNAMANARFYFLHGEDIEIYIEQDSNDNYMHIHYTHPTNSAYSGVDIATNVDFTLTNTYIFIINTTGHCSLRVFNEIPHGDGTWDTTVDYTYIFPPEFVLKPSDLFGTSTGINASSRLLSEGINYEYNRFYVPVQSIDCTSTSAWIRNNGSTTTSAVLDDDGYITSDTGGSDYFTMCEDLTLQRGMTIEIDFMMKNSGMHGYGLQQVVSNSPNKIFVFNGTMEEKHNGGTQTTQSVATIPTNTLTTITYEIDKEGYITLTDVNGKHKSNSAFTDSELALMQLCWKHWGTDKSFSVRRLDYY